MALAPCRECGANVSTAASTCPHCGVPGPAPKSARITLSRAHSNGAPTDLFVGVDEGEVYELSTAAPITEDILPGAHVLGMQWGYDGDGIVEVTFEIGHDQELAATFTFGEEVEIR